MSARYSWLFVALGLGCGGDSAAPEVVADTRTDTAEVVAPQPAWATSVFQSGNVGRQLRVAISASGVLGVASYSDRGEVGGACAGDDSGERTTWSLSYSQARGDGTWDATTPIKIVHLGPPRGFDLAFDGDGAPAIAALIGEPIPFYCGANDLGLYRPDGGGTWAGEVVVAESNEASTGEPASDFGSVVGLWPALAFGADGGPVVVYKDVHGGGLQADDFRRADLELAAQDGASWRHVAVDWGAGAGDFNDLAIDADDRPVVLMFHPRDELTDSKRGLWVLRASADPGQWDRVRVFAGGVSERPSLAIGKDGAIWVAWYNGLVGLPYVARLDPGADFTNQAAWQIRDVGDHVFDEGRQPTLAVSPKGLIGLAYQRCGRASDGIGECNPAKDALVFAWADPDDPDLWEREVIDDADNGTEDVCGAYVGLVFQGEAPTVFYQCQVKGPDGFGPAIHQALRRAL